MFYNYVLLSEKTGKLYIGNTGNLRRRFLEHNQGQNRSTKLGVPWELIYYEACIDFEDAIRRERYLKTTQGLRLLKRRLKQYFFKKKH